MVTGQHHTRLNMYIAQAHDGVFKVVKDLGVVDRTRAWSAARGKRTPSPHRSIGLGDAGPNWNTAVNDESHSPELLSYDVDISAADPARAPGARAAPGA
jgi:hypothetical protein